MKEINKLEVEEVLIIKRWLSVLVVFGCIIALSGCKNGAGQAYFDARVLEVKKGYVNVRCVESFNSGISVDEEFNVTTDVSAKSGAPEMKVDDTIRVVFDGNVMECYPLKIGKVFEISILDENGEIISNN